jgi:hypothetical protein
MIWMWYVAPVVLALLYVVTGWPDRRREAEVERWRSKLGPKAVVGKEPAGYRDKVGVKQGPGTKRLEVLGGAFQRMLLLAGGGSPIGHFELVPKLAYLSVMQTDPMSGSDHQTVVAKLEPPEQKEALEFTVRPLPIVEGERVANTGVQFTKDPEFMALFLVEPTLEGTPPPASLDKVSKVIRRWLSPPIRSALIEMPDLWLRVDNKTMALTLYGPADAEKLQSLVAAADVIFAEHGAEGGPSLLGEDEEEPAEPPAAPPPAAKKAQKKPAEKKSPAPKS